VGKPECRVAEWSSVVVFAAAGLVLVAALVESVDFCQKKVDDGL